MTNKTQPVRIDLDQYAALQALRTQTGVPVAESVRRALKLYLAAEAIKERHPRKTKKDQNESE